MSLRFEVPRADGGADVVDVPREVEAKGPEALEQFYFAQREMRRGADAVEG